MSRRADSDVVRASVVAAGPSPATQRADAQPGRRWAALVSGIVPRVLVALTFVLMALFVVVPILFTFYGATRDGSIGAPDTTFTLEWLRMVFTTRPLLTDLAATIGMSLAVAAVAVGLGTTFAWLLTRTDLGRTSILELVIMAPLFLSPLVGAIAWLILAAPESGLINVAARSLFGISGHVVDVASLGGVIFVMGLFFTPYGYLFVSAALKNMSGAFEEAAHMAGAGPLRTARKITVPMLRPAILSAFFLVAVLAAGMFGIPELLGRNSMSFVPQAVRVHRATLTLPANYGLAAALGLSILLISGIGLYW
jgi:iron(III) transport system permease protein